MPHALRAIPGEVILEPARAERPDLLDWLGKHIQPIGHIAIESTTNAWGVYNLLEPLAEKVLVANPIAQAWLKTDIRDTLILACLLVANRVPSIWVPPGASQPRPLWWSRMPSQNWPGLFLLAVNFTGTSPTSGLPAKKPNSVSQVFDFLFIFGNSLAIAVNR